MKNPVKIVKVKMVGVCKNTLKMNNNNYYQKHREKFLEKAK